MIWSCLALPARLLSTAILIAILYIGWVNRDSVRRWIHRLTAEPETVTEVVATPAELRARTAARLDSLAKHKADSVVLTPKEVEALVVADLVRRTPGGLTDSVTVQLSDGEVSVRSLIDAGKLPPGTLGPLSEWVSGRQAVEVKGAVSLLRVGSGEWRIEQVTVKGLPLPRTLWEKLLALVLPGMKGSLVFPLDRWITGIRVTTAGAILFGGRAER